MERQRVRLSKEERSTITELHNSGHNINYIANRLGSTVRYATKILIISLQATSTFPCVLGALGLTRPGILDPCPALNFDHNTSSHSDSDHALNSSFNLTFEFDLDFILDFDSALDFQFYFW
ncbi:hypothetical protein EVAR_68004_1 [Eumeta japonica]|uniref:Uncharacterized protein n=1 Tax=Eumeta variegata TaxID=151549 RepID=A0A4C1SVQ1_EUMVA|nr:hypothetical protein EVAR_68004_1 [Eumeta japonica]